MHFSDNETSIWKKNAIHYIVFYGFLEYLLLILIIIISKKCVVTPNFRFGFQ